MKATKMSKRRREVAERTRIELEQLDSSLAIGRVTPKQAITLAFEIGCRYARDIDKACEAEADQRSAEVPT